jgi:hypothetical protein
MRCIALFVLLALAARCEGQVTTGSSPADTSECDVAIVGGGPGGVYSAYRLLETNATLNVCLMEATHRVGGRVYSVRNLGPNADLILDMGAYRYMPLAQPLITDIIQNLLNLPHRLYQPGVKDYAVILDKSGSNAGFATYVEKLMMMAVEIGLQMNYNTEVQMLTEAEDGTFTLTTKDGRNITAARVILNLPSRPLHRLLQKSKLMAHDFNQELFDFYQVRATKLYLYYENAWWIANGLNNGSLAYNLPWNTTAPSVPIIGRYYDAQVKCPVMAANGTVMSSSVGTPMTSDYYYADANGLDTQNCYGYLQATYTSDGGSTNISHYPLDYLVDYASPTMGADGYALPYSVWDNTTTQGMKLLADSHMQLMAYHASQNITLDAKTMNTLPTQAVVAFWDPSVTWSGGAWHSNKTVNASEPDEVAKTIKPFDNIELYIANEAYSTQLGWSEGSLVSAENLLLDYFGVQPAGWQRDVTAANIRFGSGYMDFEDNLQGGGELIKARNAPATTTG